MAYVSVSVLVLLLRLEKDLVENKSKGLYLLLVTSQLNLRNKFNLLFLLRQRENISLL